MPSQNPWYYDKATGDFLSIILTLTAKLCENFHSQINKKKTSKWKLVFLMFYVVGKKQKNKYFLISFQFKKIYSERLVQKVPAHFSHTQ